MSQNNADDAADSDSDEFGVSETVGFSGRDGLIYVIDCVAHQSSTIANNAAAVSALHDVLDLIEVSLLNRIVAAPRDMVGIVCYNVLHSPPPGLQTGGTDAARTQHVPTNCAIVLPLQPITKACIQHVKNWRCSTDAHAFASKWGQCPAPPPASCFADMLWLCSRMLTGSDYKLFSSTLMLLTHDDRPLRGGSPSDEQRTFVRAQDLRALEVDLVVVPMCDRFDDAPFYRELVCTVCDFEMETWRMERPADIRENIQTRTFRRDYRRACLRYLALELGEGVRIGCGLYAMWQKAAMPKLAHMRVGSEQPEIVQKRRCHVSVEKPATPDDEDEDSCVDDDAATVERILLPGELTKYRDIGGRKLRFSIEELTRMRTILPPGIRLLGFKPLASLEEHAFVRPTRLLYPSERYAKGSTCLFRALWQSCLRRRLCALCVYVQMRKAKPRYVALVPQSGRDDTDEADGFRIVNLPMQTDIRHLDIFDRTIPTNIKTDQFSFMQSVVRQMQFRYDPRAFTDPTVQNVYSTLEAMVFCEPRVSTEDTTLPETQTQDERLADLIAALPSVFEQDVTTSAKRSASSLLQPSTVSKKLCSNDDDATMPLSKQQMAAKVGDGTISKLTVAVLRQFLQQFDYTNLGKLKKADLVDLVQKQCQLL